MEYSQGGNVVPNPKNRVYRAKNTANNSGFCFSWFLMYLWSVYGVSIIPKWLLNDSGPIAFFLMIFGTSKFPIKFGPVDPGSYHQNISTDTKNMGPSLRHIIFILENLKS